MSGQDGEEGEDGRKNGSRGSDGSSRSSSSNVCDVLDCIGSGGGCDDGPGCIAALIFILVLGLAYGLYYLVAMLWGGPQTWAEWRDSGTLLWSTLALAALVAGTAWWLASRHGK